MLSFPDTQNIIDEKTNDLSIDEEPKVSLIHKMFHNTRSLLPLSDNKKRPHLSIYIT